MYFLPSCHARVGRPYSDYPDPDMNADMEWFTDVDVDMNVDIDGGGRGGRRDGRGYAA